MATFTNEVAAEPTQNNDLNIAMAINKDRAATEMKHKEDQKLNPEKNNDLVACLGECTVEADTTSDKYAVSSALSQIDKQLRFDVKTVAKDGLITKDNKTLLTYELVEAAEEKFNAIIEQQKSKMLHQSEELHKQLFTSNPKLDDLGKAMLPALLPTLLDVRMIDGKPVGGWQQHVKNPAMADIILIINGHGLFPDSKRVNTSLNEAHTPQVTESLRDLAADGKKLIAIAKSQSQIFKTMKPSNTSINKIKANAFKKRG